MIFVRTSCKYKITMQMYIHTYRWFCLTYLCEWWWSRCKLQISSRGQVSNIHRLYVYWMSAMCVCVCVCVYMYTHTHTHTYIYIYYATRHEHVYYSIYLFASTCASSHATASGSGMAYLRISVTILEGWALRNLNMLSITLISVDVVSSPQKADQSFTQSPAASTSLPLFTVPATIGTWRSDDNSSWSSTDVRGCTWRKESWICIWISIVHRGM